MAGRGARVYLTAGLLFVSATTIAVLLAILLFVLNEWVESLFADSGRSTPTVDVDVSTVDYVQGIVWIQLENESKAGDTVVCRVELDGLSPSSFEVRLAPEALARRIVRVAEGQALSDFLITPTCAWE